MSDPLLIQTVSPEQALKEAIRLYLQNGVESYQPDDLGTPPYRIPGCFGDDIEIHRDRDQEVLIGEKQSICISEFAAPQLGRDANVPGWLLSIQILMMFPADLEETLRARYEDDLALLLQGRFKGETDVTAGERNPLAARLSAIGARMSPKLYVWDARMAQPQRFEADEDFPMMQITYTFTVSAALLAA